MAVRAACLLLLWGIAGPLCAEPEPTPETRADALAKAAKGEAFEVLAAQGHPDPWLVTEVLLRRGQLALARRFVKATTAEGTQGLAGYVATHGDALAGDAEAAEAGGPVTGLAAGLAAAKAHQAAGRHDDAVAAFDRVAARAQDIGWWTLASEAHRRAGNVLYARSAFAEAGSRFARNLAAEKRLGSTIGEGRAQFRVALVQRVLGRTRDADAALETATTLSEKAGDAYYLAKCRAERGYALIHAQHIDDGIAAFQSAWETYATIDIEALPHRQRPAAERVARDRQGVGLNLASMHARNGDVDKGRAYARGVVRAARKAGMPHLIKKAQAFLATLDGAIADQTGEPLSAHAHYVRAERIYGQLDDVVAHADALRRLANVRLTLGDVASALADIERAIELIEPTGAMRDLQRAHAGAGAICTQLGRLADAERHVARALALAKAMGDAELQISALVTQAHARTDRKDFAGALRLLHQAQALHAAHPQTDDVGIEVALAIVSMGVGEHGAAESRYEALLARDPPIRSVATILAIKTRLADALHRRHEHEAATKLFHEVLAAHERSGNRSAQLSVLHQLGHRALWALEYADALAYAQRGLGIATAGADQDSEVQMRLLYGRTLIWNKERERAHDEILFALEVAQGLEDVPLVASAHAHLAESHFWRGEHDEAKTQARHAVELGVDHALERSETSRAHARARFTWPAMWGLLASMKSSDRDGYLYFAERMRATSVVVSLGGRDRLRAAHVPRAMIVERDAARGAAAMAYQRWVSARARPDLTRRREAKAVYDKALARERDAVTAVQGAIRSQAALADLGNARPIDIASARALLAPTDALVVYAHDGYNYDALVITPTKATLHTLVSMKHGRNVVARLAGDPEAKTFAADLASARKYFLESLKLPADVKRLIISPDGAMSYIPWAALGSGHEICMVPSATAWRALRALEVHPGDKVLAIADPAYGKVRHVAPRALMAQRSGAFQERSGSFAPLPETRAEAKAIADVMYLGDEASETKLREVLTKTGAWKAIHLACHGIVDDVTPTRSALVLTQDGKNDGFLHADEIHDQIHLDTELVVLSACETGRGRIVGGEGVLGLSRSFMLAGAPRVLCSLWKVDDEATRALMTRFYALWNPKPGKDGKRPKALSPTRALQQAQAHVRSQPRWKDPQYWAAWVLWGLPD